jgi:hypothetical protein
MHDLSLDVALLESLGLAHSALRLENVFLDRNRPCSRLIALPHQLWIRGIW